MNTEQMNSLNNVIDQHAAHLDIIRDVLKERQRQDDKFGKNRNQHPFVWMVILGEEVGEVNKASLEWMYAGKTLDEYRMELVQVAAVSIAAILDLDNNGQPNANNDGI